MTYKQIRSKILVMLTHNIALPILKVTRKEKPFPYSKEELLQMGEGTLGRDLIEYLQQRNLDLLPYYARHDMKHLLLGYDTTEEGEICMQCFMLGNGRVSFPVIISVVFGFITPEHWKKMKHSYKLGKQSMPVHQWNWFGILHIPTQELRNKIFQKNKA